MSSYFNSGTGFDLATGIVSCHFASSAGFTPFATTYQMANISGGQIVAQTINSITINQMLGIKSF